jgi:hypothetical protein
LEVSAVFNCRNLFVGALAVVFILILAPASWAQYVTYVNQPVAVAQPAPVAYAPPVAYAAPVAYAPAPVVYPAYPAYYAPYPYYYRRPYYRRNYGAQNLLLGAGLGYLVGRSVR